MKPALLLAFLSRGYSLRSGSPEQSISLYNPAGELECDIQPEVVEKLLADGLISASEEELERIYSLTAKARMLMSLPG